MSDRPNVIVIIADDMGYGDLGSVNGGLSVTPHLDALAAQSVCMNQAYAAAPVCAPARAALMTGRYPHRTGCVCLNGLHGLNRLATGEETLGDLFSRNGYRTALIGKWHLGEIPECHPNRRGFDEFQGFNGAGDYFNFTLNVNGEFERSDGIYLTNTLTDRAVDFVERNGKDQGKPFFLYLGHYAPHRPLQAPEDLVRRHRERREMTPGQACVYAMIERMDEGIGRALEALDRLGIAENTIVIFTSDNGPDCVNDGDLSPVRPNCNLNGTKYQVYEGGIRVPFLVRWPAGGLEGGRRNNSLLHFTDVFPTLASMCDLERSGSQALDGVDRLDPLREETDQHPVRFWQWNRYTPLANCNLAMRDGSWKLVLPEVSGSRHMHPSDGRMLKDLLDGIRNGTSRYDPTPVPEQELGPPGQPELYDLGEDPGEQVNLAKENPARVAAMKREADRWFESVMVDFDRIHGEMNEATG